VAYVFGPCCIRMCMCAHMHCSCTPSVQSLWSRRITTRKWQCGSRLLSLWNRSRRGLTDLGRWRLRCDHRTHVCFFDVSLPCHIVRQHSPHSNRSCDNVMFLLVDGVHSLGCDSMLVVFCLLFYFIIVYDLCCFYSICIVCYCDCVSDHLGPSASINLTWLDFNLSTETMEHLFHRY